MLSLLKVFGRGILITLLLPFILLIWVFYGVYCIGLFIFMFFKSTIEYFQGKTFNAELPEDIESKRLLLEKEKSDEQAKEALSMMYQNAMTQKIEPPIEDNHFDEQNNNPQDEEPYQPNNHGSLSEKTTQNYDDEYGDDLDDLRGN